MFTTKSKGIATFFLMLLFLHTNGQSMALKKTKTLSKDEFTLLMQNKELILLQEYTTPYTRTYAYKEDVVIENFYSQNYWIEYSRTNYIKEQSYEAFLRSDEYKHRFDTQLESLEQLKANEDKIIQDLFNELKLAPIEIVSVASLEKLSKFDKAVKKYGYEKAEIDLLLGIAVFIAKSADNLKMSKKWEITRSDFYQTKQLIYTNNYNESHDVMNVISKQLFDKRFDSRSIIDVIRERGLDVEAISPFR